MAADLFCGAGGLSSGLLQAVGAAGVDVDLLAVNHWQVAVDTHGRNHPRVRHMCADIESVDPRKAVPGGRLHLLMGAPECRHHSNARGGKPMNDQQRASAWYLLHWCEALYIENLLIENVREFRDWGPLGANGRPLKSKKGVLYQQFLRSLRALGYTVEDRLLCAANYGDATTRTRLFIQAKRAGRKITWPEPTHLKPGGDTLGLYDGAPAWRAAREIIDWSIPSKSIFGRKKALALNTMARIFAGLRKFCGLPFLMDPAYKGANGTYVYGTDRPAPTVTARSDLSLVEPFLVIFKGQSRVSSIDAPTPTVTSGANFGLCQPFLVPAGGPNVAPSSVEDPLRTVLTRDHLGLVQPFLVAFRGNHAGRQDGAERVKSLDEPLPTQDCSNRFGLCEPFVLGQQSGAVARSVSEPLPTVAAAGAIGLISPCIVPLNHGAGDMRSYSVDHPFPTVTSVDAWGLAEPFLVKFNGTGGPLSVDEPLDTVTARDRFGLATPELQEGETLALLDIRFRMLQPQELAAAQGFPREYDFAGNREERVRQIGNAVPVNMGRALCAAILGGHA